MTEKPGRLVGINHVALEVDDLDAALAFYRGLFSFELRGRLGSHMAFLDAGDQFVAISTPSRQPPDDGRHVGLVVDDRNAVRRALTHGGVEIEAGQGLRFVDPWGNHVEIVQYDEIQFTKAPAVLRGMGLAHLGKTPEAREELRDKGLGDCDGGHDLVEQERHPHSSSPLSRGPSKLTSISSKPLARCASAMPA